MGDDRGQDELVETTAVDELTPAQQALHRNYLVSVKTMKKGLVRAAFYLEKIRSLGIHRLLGYKTIAAYAAIYGGFTPDQIERFLHLARRLPTYPAVTEALESGDLSWGKARVIVTKTDPQDQLQWLELAGKVSVGELGRAAAAPPPPPPEQEPEPKPEPKLEPKLEPKPEPAPQPVAVEAAPRPQAAVHYVTLKFDAEGLARWNRALETGMQRAKARCKEEAVLAGLAALAGGQSAGGSPPILLTIIECPTCGAGAIPTGRGEAPASPALLSAAHCDAIIEDAGATRRQVIPPRLRREAFRRARYTCQSKSCERTIWLEIHHRRPVAGAGLNKLENLIVLCSECHRRLHNSEAAARAAAREAPD